jgi:hypothetical protein
MVSQRVGCTSGEDGQVAAEQRQRRRDFPRLQPARSFDNEVERRIIRNIHGPRRAELRLKADTFFRANLAQEIVEQ